MLEQITIFIFILLAVGVVYPMYAIVLGISWIIFRTIAIFGYKMKPEYRAFGIVPMTLTNFALFFLAVKGSLHWYNLTNEISA